jgi:hypothetical protein
MQETTKKKTKSNRQRSETLNMRIDPKLKYLAEITAREQDRTLSSFIERAVRRALTPQAVSEDEPGVGAMIDPTRQTKPLWNEGFWDADEEDRFFMLATMRSDLLTIPEQRLWKLFTMHMSHTKRKITVEAFREFWNNPAINSHLTEGNE